MDFHGAGTILRPHWILTARHVVVNQYDDPESNYFNISKMDNLYVYPKYHNNLSHFYWKPSFRVKNLFCYPFSSDRDRFFTDADLALIQLEDPIPLGDQSEYKFESIEMNTKFINFDHGEIDLIAAGWGLTVYEEDPGEERTNYDLRKAKYTSRAVNLFDQPDFRPYQQFSMVNLNQEICDGDSGGPVVMRDPSSGKDLQAGVISYGSIECK